jgi:hypothetical protein
MEQFIIERNTPEICAQLLQNMNTQNSNSHPAAPNNNQQSRQKAHSVSHHFKLHVPATAVWWH